MTNKLKRITAIALTALTVMSSLITVKAQVRYSTIVADNSYISPLNYSGSASLTEINGVYTVDNRAYTARAFALQAGKNYVKIGVANGDYIYGRDTVSDMVKKYKREGYRVIGALNGDFFDTSRGLPLGIQIDNGRIYATNSPYNDDGDIAKNRTSVGFKEDGSVVFGVPELEIKASIAGYSVDITRINTPPNYDGGWLPVTLLTEDYNQKTMWTTGKAYDIIVLDIEGDISINEDTTCHFCSIIKNQTSPITIEKGKAYVVAAAGYFEGFTPPAPPEGEDKPKDVSYISVVDKTDKWDGVVTAIGGGNPLIMNGKIVAPSTYDYSIKYAVTPRTAFGVKADGTYVFYVADLSGMRMDAIAQAMYDMGCVNAVNLDGGGSTTLYADEGDGLALQNRPKDGSERKVSNAILILSRETAPTVKEDFESEKSFIEQYDGTNLVSARLEPLHKYTGKSSLAIDYTLSAVGESVSILFDPINVKAYDYLSLAIDMNESDVMLEAMLKTTNGIFTRPITDSGKDFARHTLKVNDADELLGFTLTYKKGGKNKNTVFVDRIAAWTGTPLTDNTAPSITLETKNNTLTATAKKSAYKVPVDKNAIEMVVNGKDEVFSSTLDTSKGVSDKINRVRVDAVDVFGNRSVKYSLFKTQDYSAPLPFSDMKDGKWDSLFIRYCFENNIISGFSENGKMLFKGSERVTRAQFCLMVVRQKGLDVNDYLNVKMPYEDADDIPAWAVPYVRAAYAEGIMTGTKTDTGVKFYPDNNITRAEAASALDRLMIKDPRLCMSVSYKDQKDIGNWAKTAVASVSTQGLFEGDKDGNFYPNNNLTRSEAAVLMSKL